ncbi:hypothetical protein [Bifidobacterium xylocopae]|uniref:Uncharacterized protein n=1 Tax=Bifidobacterium xylocopae TaxID=2493119 RepID=A0A366KC08_9BIFI|nr:hypothetical protein [Bifidobacterium xylocopae]RBP99275.1 hypothetical protein CRD59_04415 [Bifidobacterium xylocopae]
MGIADEHGSSQVNAMAHSEPATATGESGEDKQTGIRLGSMTPVEAPEPLMTKTSGATSDDQLQVRPVGEQTDGERDGMVWTEPSADARRPESGTGIKRRITLLVLAAIVAVTILVGGGFLLNGMAQRVMLNQAMDDCRSSSSEADAAIKRLQRSLDEGERAVEEHQGKPGERRAVIALATSVDNVKGGSIVLECKSGMNRDQLQEMTYKAKNWRDYADQHSSIIKRNIKAVRSQ